jgi:hypothetical protein
MGGSMSAEDVARGLYAMFSSVPEPRSDRGRRHPLAATLTLVVLATFDGASSPKSIAEWGRHQPSRLVAAMGFPRQLTASGSTIRNIRRRIDLDIFVSTFREWTREMPIPKGIDVQFDSAAPFGFQVRRRDSPPIPSIGEGPPLRKPGKRPSQLRRWRHRA